MRSDETTKRHETAGDGKWFSKQEPFSVPGVIDVSPFPEDDDSASESCSPLPVPRSRAVYDGHGVRPRRTASVLVQEMMALEEVEEYLV